MYDPQVGWNPRPDGVPRRGSRSLVYLRLYGIDCPEEKQALGTRAKQFTSDLVFGKGVGVEG